MGVRRYDTRRSYSPMSGTMRCRGIPLLTTNV